MGTAELISLQLRMFLIMLLGLLFRKKNIISREGKKNLTDLVIYLILPCNIVQSFMIEFDSNVLMNFGLILLISVVIQLFCAGLARSLYRRVQESHRPVLMYATVASNAGFLGNPVAEGVFGSMGLALASVYLIPQRIVMWSAGVSYFTKGTDRKTILKRVVTHPCIIAVAVGMILMLTRVSLPSFLNAALKDIGSCNTAISMLVIGTILADVRFREMLDKSVFLFSGLRLILIPLAVYLGCHLFCVDALVTGVAVLLAAMPAASTTAILAAKYEGDAVYAGKCVVLSTVLSLAVTPVWSMVLLEGMV